MDQPAAADVPSAVPSPARMRAAAFYNMGITLRGQGRAEQAAAMFQTAAETDPSFTEAHFNLATTLAESGRPAEAVEAFRAVIGLEAGAVAAHFGLGNALARCGRWAEAVPAFEAAARLAPDAAEPAFALGQALLTCGRPAEAVEAFRSALRRSSYLPAAYEPLARALDGAGRRGEAAAAFRAAALARPDSPMVQFDLGRTLFATGRAAEALAAFGRAVRLRPDWAEAHGGTARALAQLGRHQEALAACAAALSRQPDLASAHATRADVLKAMMCPDEAVSAYRLAIALAPHQAAVQVHLGDTLLQLGRPAESATACRAALALAPTAAAHNNLGNALKAMGHVAEAGPRYAAALALAPEDPLIRLNHALALLTLGRFEEGWEEYEWRWRKSSFTSPRRSFTAPLWDGSPLAGRTILVHAEQGLGDTLQFARYLPLVAASAGRLLVECQSPSLRPLLERIPGVAAVFAMGEELPPFDLQVPLLSLPRLCGTTLETIPAQLPYLEPDPARLSLWGERLAQLGGVRVGLAWAGKPNPDPFRSCTLNALAPLWEVPCVTFYSLQPGCSPGDADGLELVDLTAQINDFADTAALIAHLDLVISIDTSVAHLAGALGKPVWLMLPKAGDWRWLTERPDSPWYPTMRIFRQKRQGEWGDVVQRVAEALDAQASRILEQAALREPLNGWRHQLCGEYLAGRGRHREAYLRFTKAAQLLPQSWQPHYALGESLMQLGRVAEAQSSFRAGLSVDAEVPALHEAVGIIRQLQGDIEGAILCYRAALTLDSNRVKARYNLATACRELGMFHDALREFTEVVRLAPEHADAHWNLGIMLLMTGNLPEGWREFSWRYRKSARPPRARWQDRPRWDGSSLSGQTVLLWGEQGLGDTLQFVRYAPLVAARGARVLVEVQSRSLVSLISRVAGVGAVVVAGEAAPDFNLHASLLDLPGIFATSLDTVPDAVPYLHLPAASEPLPHPVWDAGTLKVGVVWSGNPGHENDANRSIPPEQLTLLAGVDGVAYYSLQLRPGRGKDLSPRLCAGAGGDGALAPLQMTDLSSCIRDFSDTARIAGRLDLIITVDTSVAHLCGGLGLPVWVLLPFIPDWRWLLEREDSPWYPTMRLFRQQGPGGWEGVLLRVREALQAVAAGKGGAARSLQDEGTLLAGRERFADAARLFQRALPYDPRNVELLNNLGCAFDGAGRHDEATAVYRRALRLEEGCMALHYNLGNSLKALGRSAEAIASYRRALSLDPTLPQAWRNLGLSLQEMAEYDEAVFCFRRALTLCPGYLEACHDLGELHRARGEFSSARSCYQEVLEQDPRHLPSWNSLGIALQAEDRLEEAVGCYRKALSLSPGYLHALNNLGTALRAAGEPEHAMECYRKVLALDPDYPDAHWNLALVQLQTGNYRDGWRKYEWRFRKVDPVPVRQFSQPRWDGAPLEGKRILLHAEQGFGDTLQFVRYAGELAKLGGVVLLECQSEALAPLLARVPGVTRVLVRGTELPPFDLHAPLMSLPYLCGTSLETIPAPIPYLCADPTLAEEWRGRIGDGGFKVGLVWAGRKSYGDDARRSLSLQHLSPLAEASGARFFSLQVGAGSEQAASPPAGMELAHLGPEIRNFADSAAIIANLDLVISVDTAVAHLAGGMGKPVWVLLPAAADWRWLMQREDSPWYPGARLFRQSRRGEWEEVLQRVARQLKEELRKSGREP